MARNSHTRAQDCEEPPWLTRDRLTALALLGAVGISLYLCYKILTPFLPALTWALALAIMANPLFDRIEARIRKPGAAALVTVTLVAVALLAPMVWLSNEIVSEASVGLEKIESEAASGRWRAAAERNPYLAPAMQWIERRFDLREEAKRLVESLRGRIGPLLSGTAWGILQGLIALFALFYFFRDRASALSLLRSMAPLSEREVRVVFERVQAIIHATVYGTLAVAAVQGLLGGLMFWILGLPGPILWGTAMGLVAVVPVLGAFIIWAPAAAFLAMEGDWGKALILTAWGTFVVGLIDNLLYPMLVGKEMRLHTLPVFIAIVGGLAVFGASGLILGPLVLAVALALLDTLWRRTAHGQPAEVKT